MNSDIRFSRSWCRDVFMRIACICLIAGAFTVVDGRVYAGQDLFFDGADDIPIMPGMIEMTERGFRFDKPEGEIVEVYSVMGAMSRAEVVSFYQKTLPQLGWGRAGETSYYRDMQTLDIFFVWQDGEHLMRILVRPSL